MKIDEMPILHSALTTLTSQGKPSALPKTTKELQNILEDREAESETDEVITIYISPSDSNDASSAELDLEESTRSIISTSSETETLDSSKSAPPKRRIFNKRYVGDFKDAFSGNLRVKWNNARAKVDSQRKKIKTLQQRNRRLKNRIVRMKSTLKHLHQSGNNAR